MFSCNIGFKNLRISFLLGICSDFFLHKALSSSIHFNSLQSGHLSDPYPWWYSGWFGHCICVPSQVEDSDLSIDGASEFF